MNAKKEFIEHVGKKDILCCTVRLIEPASLTTGWVESEYDEFLKAIDVTYDSGYGGQELYGMIWYKDGTWSSRGEYDGSEWWEHHTCPAIPGNLNRLDKVREEKLNEIVK